MPNQNIQLERRKTTSAKKKKRKRPGLICHVLMLGCAAALFYLLWTVKRSGFLPNTYILIGALVLCALLLLFWNIWFRHTRRPVTRFFCGILAVALAAVSCMGCYYIDLAVQVLDQITDFAGTSVHTVSAVVLDESSLENLTDLEGKTIALMSQADTEATQKFVDEVSKSVQCEFVDYQYMLPAARALKNGSVDALALPESVRQYLHETGEFYEFQFYTRNVAKISWVEERETSVINYPDSVEDITEDPFTILISGNDSYGEMSETARSDVNMLVTINPLTHTVLLTSLPRDSYVEVTCSKNQNACEAGTLDKLTHTGLDGVGVTESTIEDLLGIDINYTVRVNFSSLTALIDALGGVDVYVEEGLAVDSFWTNPTVSVSEGWNHLDGEGALAFSRERYAYQDGDLQRIRNQQIVIQAILDKVLSLQMITSYPAFMDALSIACETNLPADDIKALIRMEMAGFPQWDIQSYALSGTVYDAYCWQLQDYASVTQLKESSIQTAAKKIQAVCSGEDPSHYEEEEEEQDSATGEQSGSYEDSYWNSDSNSYGIPDQEYGYDSGYDTGYETDGSWWYSEEETDDYGHPWQTYGS